VCRIESARGLPEDREHPLRVETPLLLDEPPEIGALDELHRDKELSVRLTGFEHRDDAGMCEVRAGFRLADEALPEAFVVGEIGRHELQSDDLVAGLVASAEDDAHAPTADLALDEVIAESLTDAPVRRPGGSVVRVHLR
jgi:hypothetical protein